MTAELRISNYNYNAEAFLQRLAALFQRDQSLLGVVVQRSVLLTSPGHATVHVMTQLDVLPKAADPGTPTVTDYGTLMFSREVFDRAELFRRLDLLPSGKFQAASKELPMASAGFGDRYESSTASRSPRRVFDISFSSSVQVPHEPLLHHSLQSYRSPTEAIGQFLEMPEFSNSSGQLNRITLNVPNLNRRIARLALNERRLDITTAGAASPDSLKLDLTYKAGNQSASTTKSLNGPDCTMGLEFLPTELQLWLISTDGFLADFHDESDQHLLGTNSILRKRQTTTSVSLFEPKPLVTIPGPSKSSPSMRGTSKRSNLRPLASSDAHPKKGMTFRTAFDTYSIEGQIGIGGSGIVYKVLDSEDTPCALKVLDTTKANTKRLRRFKNEINFCSKNNHKNIVQVLGTGVTDNGATFYVMPLYSCTLRELISRGLRADDVIPTFTQILNGVEAAHFQGVWHRDLKPENVLCSPSQNAVVVADFGIAHFEEEELLTAVETKADERLANFLYAAPEQKVRGQAVDNKADIYALGLMLQEMLTGDVPLGTGHRTVADVAPSLAYLDPLIDVMRSQDPTRRPSIGDVKRELITRGNQFVELQRLNDLKKQVVPESELEDSLISDPIRIVDKLDYRDGVLVLKLNQAVNQKWESCFRTRATRFSANVSSAVVRFGGDQVRINVSEHSLQEGVRFVQDYIPLANEDYAAQARREHQTQIEKRRSALRSQIAQEEARRRILDNIKI